MQVTGVSLLRAFVRLTTMSPSLSPFHGVGWVASSSYVYARPNEI